ncbi:SDR family oxidoreductase [Archangium violaceum]|uniref:SDR family NAD(P)-dependent oxidoreductase n=1 Tax=Archangium violaceum TaxID=83451 RepID=UPI00193B1B8A|nr:SDR family oxidoreductase [Archangium violaceum]QRK09580.1 SDR family oxidoreductase [Archangium violaceum]
MTDTRVSRTFQGKVARVTGAGSGMGRAAAVAFAREGASVVLAGRRRAELDAVAVEVESAGGRALAVPTDVAKAEEVERLVRTTLERFDRLDAAFNNAGVEGVFAPIHDSKVEDFDSTFAINVRGIIDTPMLRRLSTEESRRPFIAHVPARRLGSPEEVADVVLWLCSDGARFVTGQNILVDGGYAIAGHRPWA